MKYHFFHILAIDPQLETERLNNFLRDNPIHSIERQFVAEGNNSFWSICVVTLSQKAIGAKSQRSSSEKYSKIDYQEILSPEHFTIFTSLREFRNKIAKEHGIPAYAVFTNEQLGRISQLENIDYKSIAKMKGIAGKRLEIYTVRLLDLYNNKNNNNSKKEV